MTWINVNDYLPEINKRVLVKDSAEGEEHILTMFYEGQTKEKEMIWCEFFEGYEVGNPDEVYTTHKLEVYYRSTKIICWCPLPE